jgi:hypothetical protein
MKAENRKLFHELEVEKCLVALLGSENDGTKIAASQAISAMSENSSSKDFFNTQGKKKKNSEHFLVIIFQCTWPFPKSQLTFLYL